jgi:hypothetical protein
MILFLNHRLIYIVVCIVDVTQKFEEAKVRIKMLSVNKRSQKEQSQNEREEGLKKIVSGRLRKRVNQQTKEAEHKHLQEDRLKNEGAKSIREVEKELNMTVTEANRVQHEEEHVDRASEQCYSFNL